MKKLFIILLTLVLLSSWSYADSIDKVLYSVEKTNMKIDSIIAEAIEKSEKIVIQTNQNLLELYQGKEVIKLQSELLELNEKLSTVVDNQKEKDELQEKINQKETDLSKEIAKYALEYSEKSEKIEANIAKEETALLAEIKKVVDALLDKTNKMSYKMVVKAENEGVIILCEWVPVEINGEIIMVDPLRVFSIHR